MGETGQSYPDFQRLVLLSDYFGLTLDELVRDVDVADVRAKNVNNEKLDSIYSDINSAKKTIKWLYNCYLVVGGGIVARFDGQIFFEKLLIGNILPRFLHIRLPQVGCGNVLPVGAAVDDQFRRAAVRISDRVNPVRSARTRLFNGNDARSAAAPDQHGGAYQHERRQKCCKVFCDFFHNKSPPLSFFNIVSQG